MKKTFLSPEKPLLTAMILCPTPEECIAKIRRSMAEGADAFGVQLCQLRREYRTRENLTAIFAACGDKPIYITAYRNGESKGMSDEECVSLLLLGLDCGATLCDVIGDLFAPCEQQMTYDAAVIERQKALIDEIHRRGGEVLMSVHDLRSLTADEVLTVAKAQAARGADIIKIVVKTDSTACLPDYVRVIGQILRETGKQLLLLDCGANVRFIRQLGPNLGVCMYLCVTEHGAFDNHDQPLLKDIKAVRDHLLF